MQKEYKYKYYCVTEAAWVSEWATSEPTECANNAGHTIKSDSHKIAGERPVYICSHALNTYNPDSKVVNAFLPMQEVNYTTVLSFTYMSDETPTKMVTITEQTTNTFYVRLYNLTQRNIVAEFNTTNASYTETETSVSNAPDKGDTLELRLKITHHSGDNAHTRKSKKGMIHQIMLTGELDNE